MTSTIPQQVKLPLSVAVGVVAQGIRIRFGRSLVTVTGVVCGIAFLMSILAGQVLRRGVGEEEAVRTGAARMLSFLTAEMGPVEGKSVVLVRTAAPLPAEARLLEVMMVRGLEEVRVVDLGGPFPPVPARPGCRVVAHTDSTGASAVLVWGGAVDPALAERLLRGARQPVLAFTRPTATRAIPAVRVAALDSAPTPEQEARAAAAAATARFRNGWIIAISLLVTVIGITNAMLMSVTERFREIGTMKCLGALSAFVRTMFLIESAFMGLVGGLGGVGVGLLFSFAAYVFTYGLGLTWASATAGLGLLAFYALAALAAGLVLSVLAAIYPASVASRMVPAHALRSNV